MQKQIRYAVMKQVGLYTNEQKAEKRAMTIRRKSHTLVDVDAVVYE